MPEVNMVLMRYLRHARSTTRLKCISKAIVRLMLFPLWASVCAILSSLAATVVPLALVFGSEAFTNPATLILLAALPIGVYYRVCMYLPLIGGVCRIKQQSEWPDNSADDKVSLIVPAYNEEEGIAECMRCILLAVRSDIERLSPFETSETLTLTVF